MNNCYLPANWPLDHVLAGTTRTEHPHADSGFNLARHISCDRMIVEANRQAWSAMMELEGRIPMWLVQMHSKIVVDDQHYRHGVEADAAISRSRDYIPVVLTADCVPVLLSNERGDEVAAVHAGWQGLVRGVIAETLQQMQSAKKDLYAWIGPCINQPNYEVDDAFRQQFLTCDEAYQQYFAPVRPGHWLADLVSVAKAQLTAGGVSDERIYLSGECTFADQGYFSHRRDAALSGRMASFIAAAL